METITLSSYAGMGRNSIEMRTGKLCMCLTILFLIVDLCVEIDVMKASSIVHEVKGGLSLLILLLTLSFLYVELV